MKQYKEVISVMEENGGFSTLGNLYQNVDVSKWKTKTPFASIRRIVQDEKIFFKIKPGLWALKSHEGAVLEKFSITEKSSKNHKEEFNHSYYQGLLVEVGNLEGFKTFIPNQDKNKLFLSKPLKAYTTAIEFYNFTYDYLIKKVNTIDVCWFNERNFPDTIFEVEHSTDIVTSLMKFLLLRDFDTKFNIVASLVRKREYESKFSSPAFIPIRNKVKFIEYDSLSNYHSKLCEISALKNRFYK